MVRNWVQFLLLAFAITCISWLVAIDGFWIAKFFVGVAGGAALMAYESGRR